MQLLISYKLLTMMFGGKDHVKSDRMSTGEDGNDKTDLRVFSTEDILRELQTTMTS